MKHLCTAARKYSFMEFCIVDNLILGMYVEKSIKELVCTVRLCVIVKWCDCEFTAMTLISFNQ